MVFSFQSLIRLDCQLYEFLRYALRGGEAEVVVFLGREREV